jgi:type II secretory pathway pseudopilin PulG
LPSIEFLSCMALFSNARPSTSRPRRGGEDGYVFLTLMLMVTMLVIAAAAVMPTIAFEIRRDREQEMIHRGVQYSRAIRNYYKKFGRYPTRLEDLDNTNNLRYLRKHYKDPVTGQDFKLLHYGDPGLSMMGSAGGAGITGANSVSQMNGQAGSASAFGGSASAFSQPSSFGGNSNSAFGGGSSFGGGSNSAFGGGSSFGGGSNSAFGGNSNSASGGGSFANSGASGTSSGNPTSPGSGSPSSSPEASQSGTGSSQDPSSPSGGSNSQGNNQAFGGGPIVGVASASKKDSIREFNHKHKYNEWQFVYDPTLDRGGLILTPSQPALQMAGTPPSQIGQPAGSNSSGSAYGQSGFGQSSSFGQSSGFGNNNSGPLGGPSTPAQPPSNPPQ